MGLKHLVNLPRFALGIHNLSLLSMVFFEEIRANLASMKKNPNRVKESLKFCCANFVYETNSRIYCCVCKFVGTSLSETNAYTT